MSAGSSRGARTRPQCGRSRNAVNWIRTWSSLYFAEMPLPSGHAGAVRVYGSCFRRACWDHAISRQARRMSKLREAQLFQCPSAADTIAPDTDLDRLARQGRVAWRDARAPGPRAASKRCDSTRTTRSPINEPNAGECVGVVGMRVAWSQYPPRRDRLAPSSMGHHRRPH